MAPSDGLWQVIGGGDAGGIIVREGKGLSSAQAPIRLATGSQVRELEHNVATWRLHYELVSGTGPFSGWVSTKIQGKELLTKIAEKTVPPMPVPQAAPSAPTAPKPMPRVKDDAPESSEPSKNSSGVSIRLGTLGKTRSGQPGKPLTLALTTAAKGRACQAIMQVKVAPSTIGVRGATNPGYSRMRGETLDRHACRLLALEDPCLHLQQ